ncbi:MAG: amidohydrolase family protein [Bryobacteraceae bacterium]|nr:amidohydrolase family protein [Bryobacteraceae bacterium]
MPDVARRSLLGSLPAAALSRRIADHQNSGKPIPIIDCHIHLFDQTRPQGAPYSAGPRNREPALPARYRRLAAPLGIVGAIKVEASPWIEDNLWVLHVVETDSMMVGVIGNLQPEKPEFREYLDRYHKNRLFLGIRYGNLWGYSLVKQTANPGFIEGLKLMQQAGMALDTANPRPDLLEAVLRVSDKAPDLRIIVDHLPAMMLRLDSEQKASAEALLRELAARPKVFIKVSAAMRVENGRALTDPALYKPLLDQIFETFGEDKLVFGSDWPNADAVDNLPAIVQIARDYFLSKGKAAAEKYFWRNSVTAYRWIGRDPSQPSLDRRG